MSNGIVYVRTGSNEIVEICDHVSIHGRVISDEEFEKDCEHHEYLVMHCNVCKEENIIGIAVN